MTKALTIVGAFLLSAMILSQFYEKAARYLANKKSGIKPLSEIIYPCP